MGKVYHLNFSSIHCHDASDLIRNWDRFPSEVGGPTVHSSDPQPGSRWLVWAPRQVVLESETKAFSGFAANQWPFQDPKLEVPTIYKAYHIWVCCK